MNGPQATPSDPALLNLIREQKRKLLMAKAKGMHIYIHYTVYLQKLDRNTTASIIEHIFSAKGIKLILFIFVLNFCRLYYVYNLLTLRCN